MMVVEIFPFKDHLNLTDRLEIASEYLRLGRFYGVITDLADAYNTNRQRIYDILNRVSEAFRPKPPGPEAKPAEALKGRIAELEGDNASLQSRVTELETKLASSIEVTEQRVRTLSLTLSILPVSYRDIRDILTLAFSEKYAPSEASICEMVQYYGTVAGLILLSERVTSKIKDACLDEIFFHRTPILTVVEPESMTVGACEREKDRTGESWQAVLSLFPNLRYVVSDEAKGISKGVRLIDANLPHQKDLYHLMREISKTTRRLENRLEKLLKSEEKAWQNWIEGRIYTKTMEKTLSAVNRQLELMEQYYQSLELLDFVFSPVTKDYKLNTIEHGQQILSEVIQRLKALTALKIKDLMEVLEKKAPGYLVFLEQLQHELESIPVESSEDSKFTAKQIREWAIEEVCLQQAMKDDPSDEIFFAYRNLWEKVRSLKKLIPVYLRVVSEVKKILYCPKRASSLVECFNSILRPIKQVKKQVTSEFLWLKALHHNMKSFKQGKRKGKSPYQLLGIDFGTQNWIELLENYQLAA